MIYLRINRNDPCPCGSGKKYKKCCLNKKQIIEIQEVKQERFFQQKHLLVEKMKAFLEANVPYRQYSQLQEDFFQRSNYVLPNSFRNGFFQFWLFFCHRFENGLRGVEWFYNEQEMKLSKEEKTMAKSWTELKLRLVEAVNQKDNFVIFEDVFTKEQFPVAKTKENIPQFIPWYGTIGLLENFYDQYYFNGVNIFKGPTNVMHVANLVRELSNKEKVSVEETLFVYYPEILRALEESQYGLNREDRKKREIHQYTVEYKILNEDLLERFLYGHDDFIPGQANGVKKTFSWAGNWKAYTDSEIPDEIIHADVYATISIDRDKLIITCFDKQKLAELKEIFNKAVLAVQKVSEKTKSFEIPMNATVKNSFVQMEKNYPQYFSLYAQMDLMSEIDVPIPKFNYMSIRQLVESNRLEEAETWLKQIEYNLYLQVLEYTKEVKVTGDFNTVRKELGLPLSPFVTGGEKRFSRFRAIGNPYQKTIVDEQEIPFYEDLGFAPSTIHHFYAQDLVEFYKEKTIGKAEGTVRKYRNSLYEIRRELEHLALKSWEECTDFVWRQMLNNAVLTPEVSKSFQKDFLSVARALAKWLDKRKNISISDAALSAIKQTETQLTNEKTLQKA
jgi:hypothetical protein